MESSSSKLVEHEIPRVERAPLVTVGLPVFNGAKYLSNTIDSILDQTFDDFELVISDNGSNDETESICRGYALSDSRIRYYRFEQNEGAARNYNRVFELARGTYFKWAPHDDVLLPRMLEECVSVFTQAPESVVLVYPKSELIDAEGNVIRPDTTSLELRNPEPLVRVSRLLRRLSIATPITGLLRADTLRQTRLIDSFVGSDYVLMVELAMLGEYREVADTLVQRRMHAEMSRIANPDKTRCRIWFDPALASKWDPLSIKDRILVEYLKSAIRMPMSFSFKVQAVFSIPIVVLWRRFRVFVGQERRRMVAFLSRGAMEPK